MKSSMITFGLSILLVGVNILAKEAVTEEIEKQLKKVAAKDKAANSKTYQMVNTNQPQAHVARVAALGSTRLEVINSKIIHMEKKIENASTSINW